jgi:hypothetical protein
VSIAWLSLSLSLFLGDFPVLVATALTLYLAPRHRSLALILVDLAIDILIIVAMLFVATPMSRYVRFLVVDRASPQSSYPPPL